MHNDFCCGCSFWGCVLKLVGWKWLPAASKNEQRELFALRAWQIITEAKHAINLVKPRGSSESGYNFPSAPCCSGSFHRDTFFFSVLFVGIKNSRCSCNSSNVIITNSSNKAVPVILSAPFIYWPIKLLFQSTCCWAWCVSWLCWRHVGSFPKWNALDIDFMKKTFGNWTQRPPTSSTVINWATSWPILQIMW